MQKKFEQFEASVLYCNTCQQAMPVKQRLLLILPDGELYDYLCQGCGSSVGSKTDRTAPNQPPKGVLLPPT
ncbi:MAG: cytoplasmic protein [Candidatus Methylomirabilales bacterium]